MSVVASCGHVLTDEDGPDGMGWPLAVRSHTREGEPAVRHGAYCTACRDAALAQPGYVLADEAAEMTWLQSDGAVPEAPATPATSLPSYGVWSVWTSDPRNPEPDYQAERIGTYRGFVDEIALAVSWSDRDGVYFQREDDALPATEIAPVTDPGELPECVGLNVVQGDALLADAPRTIEAFFAGRPVFVKYSSWGDCVALFPASGEAGARYLKQQAELRAVLAKLAEADIAVLQEHGLKLE